MRRNASAGLKTHIARPLLDKRAVVAVAAGRDNNKLRKSWPILAGVGLTLCFDRINLTVPRQFNVATPHGAVYCLTLPTYDPGHPQKVKRSLVSIKLQMSKYERANKPRYPYGLQGDTVAIRHNIFKESWTRTLPGYCHTALNACHCPLGGAHCDRAASDFLNE
ncbi:hypothetical protein J6590_012193 [Homalodisca vitripennis]|nr:hypothetical protein J6590_012193 [Homalodisca vitripennis]